MSSQSCTENQHRVLVINNNRLPGPLVIVPTSSFWGELAVYSSLARPYVVSEPDPPLLHMQGSGSETRPYASLIPRPSHCPVFDRLQYAEMEGEGLVYFIM